MKFDWRFYLICIIALISLCLMINDAWSACNIRTYENCSGPELRAIQQQQFRQRNTHYIPVRRPTVIVDSNVNTNTINNTVIVEQTQPVIVYRSPNWPRYHRQHGRQKRDGISRPKPHTSPRKVEKKPARRMVPSAINK